MAVAEMGRTLGKWQVVFSATGAVRLTGSEFLPDVMQAHCGEPDGPTDSDRLSCYVISDAPVPMHCEKTWHAKL